MESIVTVVVLKAVEFLIVRNTSRDGRWCRQSQHGENTGIKELLYSVRYFKSNAYKKRPGIDTQTADANRKRSRLGWEEEKFAHWNHSNVIRFFFYFSSISPLLSAFFVYFFFPLILLFSRFNPRLSDSLSYSWALETNLEISFVEQP